MSRMRNIVALALLMGTSIGATVAMSSTASARTLHQGTPYGCQINPNAAGCHIQSTPIVPPPPALPPTGGGQPDQSSGILVFLMAGVLLAAGFGLRQAGRRL